MSDKNKFEEFLLSEYSNIAQAHFKSIETITTFFRYYLLIMAIPISFITIFPQVSTDTQQILNKFQDHKLFVIIVLFLVLMGGIGVFCYITSLRLDTLLYARVINSIRKYFYDASNFDISLKLQMRVLPQSSKLPSYYEKSYFLPVVFVFGIINALYSSLACYVLFKNYLYLIINIILILVLHLLIYFWYAWHREIAYLKSDILGVDIDGVLNKHREKFCSLLYKKSGKAIKPEEITVIPVHEHPRLGVTREDERKVFNDPRYWVDMDVIENAAESIRKINNMLKLKIYVFTHRPWPDNPDKEKLIDNIKEFLRHCQKISLMKILLKIIIRIHIMRKVLFLFKEKPLKQITKEWLERNNFRCNEFIFERGNDYSSDPRGKFYNRFYIARKKVIRFFVEDDIEKAIKLSYICDIVFLLKQPYNRKRTGIPNNIIPVNSWDEIFKKIRKFS